MTKRLLSGIQPTGSLHLGNYLGAIKQLVELQHDYETLVMIADYHALTQRPKPAQLRQNTLSLAALLVASGLDPKSGSLFLQSQLSEHTELGWILTNFATIGQLNRMTQFKEKADRHGQLAGLLTYPTLQAADILVYRAEAVPVGEDQAQHLELVREIARSFNRHVGQDFFPEPETLLTKSARIMALNDPTKKMSKSLPGSTIGLLEDEAIVSQIIKRAVTDSDPNSTEMSPGVKNLFQIMEGVSSEATVKHFHELFQGGLLRYSELKEQLIEDVVGFLKPIQKSYQTLMADEKGLTLMLEAGAEKARPLAAQTLTEVKKLLGIVA